MLRPTPSFPFLLLLFLPLSQPQVVINCTGEWEGEGQFGGEGGGREKWGGEKQGHIASREKGLLDPLFGVNDNKTKPKKKQD